MRTKRSAGRTSTTTPSRSRGALELRHRRDWRGVYERLEYDTPTGDLKRNFWGVSGTIPMGPGSWYVFYGRADDGKGGAADGTRIGPSVRRRVRTRARNQWEVSYTYPFSKRTSVYAGYVKIDNDSNASYTFNINPYPIAYRRQAARVS